MTTHAINAILLSDEQKTKLLQHFSLKLHSPSLPIKYQEKFEAICPKCSSPFVTSMMVLTKRKQDGKEYTYCSSCGKSQSGKTLVSSNAHRIDEFQKKFNLKLLEPYRGWKVKYKFECSCGKIVNKMPYNVEKNWGDKTFESGCFFAPMLFPSNFLKIILQKKREKR